MKEVDRLHLRAGADALGVPLTAQTEQRLVRYVELLLLWNQKLNLTAVTEPRAIVDKHLLDSLAVVPFLAKHSDGTRLLDVGTGPGLPSVVLAIVCPGLRITAVESIHKKVSFVRAVSRELELAITAEPIRLEQRAPGPLFDVAVSRATFEPVEWVERGAPWVEPGGLLLAMLSAHQKIPDPPAGFHLAARAEHELAGAGRRIVGFRRSVGSTSTASTSI